MSRLTAQRSHPSQPMPSARQSPIMSVQRDRRAASAAETDIPAAHAWGTFTPAGDGPYTASSHRPDQGTQPGDDRAVPTDLLDGSAAMPMVILHLCTFFRDFLVECQAGHERSDALGIRLRQNLRKHKPNPEARP